MELPDPSIVDAIKNDPVLAKQHLAVWADKLISSYGPESVRLGNEIALYLKEDIEIDLTRSNGAPFESTSIYIYCRYLGRVNHGPEVEDKDIPNHFSKAWVSIPIDYATQNLLGIFLDRILELD